MQFNSRGLLIPDLNIPSNLDDFEKEFVNIIQSDERKSIFENYVRYSERLKDLCNGANFLQWIDGSFVTKKPNPGDLDMVTFIDFNIIETIKGNIDQFKYPNSYQS